MSASRRPQTSGIPALSSESPPKKPRSRRIPRPASPASEPHPSNAVVPAEPLLTIRTLPLTELSPAAYNPRLDLKPGDPEFERLLRSVDEFGLVEPLVWNQRTGNLVGGHQRLKVLIAKGASSTTVSVVDLPLEREKALNLALNKIAGDWDQDKLAALLEELIQTPDFDTTITGFDSSEIDSIIAESLARSVHDEEFDLEAELARAGNGPSITKPGDLIVLGKDPRLAHRLVCGDCTDPVTVRRLMDGQRAALFATDPPYLVGYDGTNHPGTKVAKHRSTLNRDWSATYCATPAAWDDPAKNIDLYDRFVHAAITEAIARNAAFYCWYASKRQALVEQAWAKHEVLPHQQIIWVKSRPVLNRSWYTWQHEPCLFGWLQGNKPRRAEKGVLSTIWQVDEAHHSDRPDHPTPKPTELFEIPMRQHTLAGEVCYEPFAGSGSQIIAAERTGRRCFGIENSPVYCDVIVRRFIAYAGERAVDTAIAAKYRLKPGATGTVPRDGATDGAPRVDSRTVQNGRTHTNGPSTNAVPAQTGTGVV